MYLDHSKKGSKKITKEIKCHKEGIRQVEATVQHLLENMLTLETKLAHPMDDPVVYATKKVKHKENLKI